MKEPINCYEHIPAFSPEQVFSAGTHPEIMPSAVGGLVLRVSGDQIARGTAFEVGLEMGAASYLLNASVVEYRPAKHIFIFGEDDRIGDAEIWLNLSPDELRGGTEINYGLNLAYGRMVPKLARPLITGHLKKNVLPRYTAVYKHNILTALI